MNQVIFRIFKSILKNWSLVMLIHINLMYLYFFSLKFSFSEKATKMCAIDLMVLKFTQVVDVKTIMTIVNIFVAFSEKLNFKSSNWLRVNRIFLFFWKFWFQKFPILGTNQRRIIWLRTCDTLNTPSRPPCHSSVLIYCGSNMDGLNFASKPAHTGFPVLYRPLHSAGGWPKQPQRPRQP